ncbi:MAG: 16S rRNA (cytosine(1402)-N(4))-methyltransferase RsmH [Planctomycetia bacterium]|nr:16S rRNA (cytosine(1402)-N(4))-methyltransferase RsmH [Planctomycetia bacterium]
MSEAEPGPDPQSEPHRRRPRYSGRNPRQFHEKYKEHAPELYPDDVAKVLEGGKTPAGTHRPIMVREILEVLAPRPGETVVDCTLGYGGHARELLTAVQPGGRLLAVDADPLELPKTESRLRALGFPAESLVVKRMNYAGVAQFVAAEAPDGVDMVLADLGLSSMQIDDPARGFTFKADGPLDMRMNPNRGLSAAGLLAKLESEELAKLLTDNADEPLARELAEAIVREQDRRPLTTTRALAEVVREAAVSLLRRGEASPDDSVRRVFQALRIAVNDEFGALDTFLKQLPSMLKPGGRVAVLSFHSGEDRRVKAAFKRGLQAGDYGEIAEEITRATPEEQRANPRSSSAKLRHAIRGHSTF